MNSAQVMQTIRSQRKVAAQKLAASPAPLIPAEIRLTLIKEAIKLKSQKLAHCPPEVRQVILLNFVRDGLSNRKVASRDQRMLLAELEGCRKIGEFMKKEALLGRMVGKAIGMIGRGARTRPGVGLIGGAIGAGIAGQDRLTQAGSAVGGRMMNAYNALFNPGAVQSQQQMAGTMGHGAGPGAAPSAPPSNPFTADFNTMTMADFARHRAAMQARMAAMDKAYPGFAPQQPQQPFVVQQPQGKPLVYNPNGNTPRYYGV